MPKRKPSETADPGWEDADWWTEGYLNTCHAAWRAGSTKAVADAVLWCNAHRRVMPEWLSSAVDKVITKRRTKAEAQGLDARARDFLRWQTVIKLREAGVSWQRAYEQAADQLANTAARGEPATVAESYKTVARDLRAGRTAKYAVATGQSIPSDWLKRSGGLG